MSLRPEARILGPETRPALIASRSSVSPSMPEWPRLLTVVMPLSRSSRAICAPQQSALGRRFHKGEQESGRKNPVLMALCLRVRRPNDVEKQVSVAVNQTGQQSRAAQINDFGAAKVLHSRSRTNFLDLAF